MTPIDRIADAASRITDAQLEAHSSGRRDAYKNMLAEIEWCKGANLSREGVLKHLAQMCERMMK